MKRLSLYFVALLVAMVLVISGRGLAAPADNIPPKLTDVAATNIYTNYALIKWTTSEPATSEVEYGRTTGYGLSANDPTLVTDHQVKLISQEITGGTVYHFKVKSVDTGGNAVTSDDYSFRTLGGTLLITVLNQKNKGVAGAQISLAGANGTTDKKGQFKFKNLPYGEQSASVTYKGKTTTFKPNVELANLDGPDDVQPLTFRIKTPNSTPWYTTGIAVAVLLLLLLVRGRPKKRTADR